MIDHEVQDALPCFTDRLFHWERSNELTTMVGLVTFPMTYMCIKSNQLNFLELLKEQIHNYIVLCVVDLFFTCLHHMAV